MASIAAALEPAVARGVAVGVYYEHPQWFESLFGAFERLGSPAQRLHDDDVGTDASTIGAHIGVVLNRMSISSQDRGRPDAMARAIRVIDDLEARGVRVINGSRAMRIEVDKRRQLQLIRSSGLVSPRTVRAHTERDALDAIELLGGPVIVKPNFGASGTGVRRFANRDEAETAFASEGFNPGLDGIALVQRLVSARDRAVIRVEVLGGRFHYAVKVRNEGDSFNLCCASVCRSGSGQALRRPGYSGSPERSDLTIEAYTPPAPVRDAAARLLTAAGIEVGGVEYLVDDVTGREVFFDINALSNFVGDGPTLLGFDPFENLARYALTRAVR